VLHAAVATAGIADTGPLLPFLDTIADPMLLARIADAARALLTEEMAFRAKQAATWGSAVPGG